MESLAELPQLAAVYSIIGRYDRRNVVHALAMEDLSRVRVDLDTYDLDAEPDRDSYVRFRQDALRTLSDPSVVVTYRPSALVSSLAFARSDRCRYLGLFKDHQNAFEHKPWVETSLADLGVPGIPWHYVADEEQLETLRVLKGRSVVLRRSRTSGGVGLTHVEHLSAETLRDAWPQEADSYVSVAPFLGAGIPVNVGGVVWDDGTTLHPASLQIIGIKECTLRRFGYCGNDFGAVRDLGEATLDAIEGHTRTIADWLRGVGYRGAFGVDYLVVDGNPLFTEVNPRFQGSTHLSAQISVERNASCILLDHVAALLGIPCPKSLSLREYADSSSLAHLVVHWTGSSPVNLDGWELENALRAALPLERIDVVAPSGATVQPGGTIARLTTRTRLTQAGMDIPVTWKQAVLAWSTPGAGCSASTPK